MTVIIGGIDDYEILGILGSRNDDGIIIIKFKHVSRFSSVEGMFLFCEKEDFNSFWETTEIRYGVLLEYYTV